MYAYAVLGHHPGVELLSAIAKGVQWQLRDFSPQACVCGRGYLRYGLISLSCCATKNNMLTGRPAIPIGCTRAAVRLFKTCLPPSARCDTHREAMSSAAGTAGSTSLHALGAHLLLFIPQGLSNICWAHAKLGAEVTEEVARLLEALAVEAVSQLMDIRSRQKFIPQVCACLL